MFSRTGLCLHTKKSHGGHGKKFQNAKDAKDAKATSAGVLKFDTKPLIFSLFWIQLTLFRMVEATTATKATQQSRYNVGTRLQALCLFENKVLVTNVG